MGDPSITVHVWIARPGQVTDEALLSKYRSILDADERDRLERFRFERDRHSFLVSHALVRWMLSSFEDRAPADWRFVTNEHGRPDPDPGLESRLRFNLSHTRGVAACAVGPDLPLGVDVEAMPERADLGELARHAFSADERRHLESVDPQHRPGTFLEVWTLKEAYVKAIGAGFSANLGSFAVLPDDPVSIRFDDGRGDPGAWRFEQRWVDTDVSLGLAVRSGARPLSVEVRDDVVPLVA